MKALFYRFRDDGQTLFFRFFRASALRILRGGFAATCIVSPGLNEFPPVTALVAGLQPATILQYLGMEN